MYILLTFLLALAGGAFALTVIQGKESWQHISLRDSSGVPPNYPEAGFEPEYPSGEGPLNSLYLCLAQYGGQWRAGKLIHQPEGDLACHISYFQEEIVFRSNNDSSVKVLTTPANCWGWEPNDYYSIYRGTPPHYMYGATDYDGNPTPICRANDPKLQVLAPGILHGSSCYYPFHGAQWSYNGEGGKQEIDILTWSDYALIWPENCT